MYENLVKKLLQLPIKQRIDCLEEHQNWFLADENRPEVEPFVKANNLTYNTWYNVLIVELAESLQIVCPTLLAKYHGYLLASNHYLVKLAVLDYLENTSHLYTETSVGVLQKLMGMRNPLIVKNHVLLLLCLVNPLQKEHYFGLLQQSLSNTHDHRSHIRTLNFIIRYPKLFGPASVQSIISIVESMDLGRGVEMALQEIKQKL